MPNRLEERSLQLTEEEAIGLLELAMSCPMDLSPEQRTAVVKLGDFCRQFMRNDAHAAKSEALSDKKEVLLPPACAA